MTIFNSYVQLAEGNFLGSSMIFILHLCLMDDDDGRSIAWQWSRIEPPHFGHTRCLEAWNLTSADVSATVHFWVQETRIARGREYMSNALMT